MDVRKTTLDGVLLCTPAAFEDHRGVYVETYNQRDYKAAGVDADFVQDDISRSSRHVLRGIHGDDVTWKLVSCLHGRLYLVVVDCREGRESFGRWEAFTITAANRQQVLVPPNFGNAHLVLSESAIFHYKQSSYYPTQQFSYRWDDPRFDIWWPVASPQLSQRDQRGGARRGARQMRILVTGGTGFLGAHLCRALRTAGHQVTSLGSAACDLRDPAALYAVDGTYDQLYHLAAYTQAGDFSLRFPGDQWLYNQQFNTNVLAWWRDRQPQAKLIFMGTSCAYPEDVPLIEDNYLEGRPAGALFTYGMTKRMLLAGAMAMASQHGLSYLCIVPSTVYGPGYHTDPERQLHFIFDIARKILRGTLYGEPVVLWGDGWQEREVVAIDDFTRLTLALAAQVDNDVVNIGAGEGHSIREFAQLICQEVGYPFESIAFDVARGVGAKAKVLSVEKLKSLLGVGVETTLSSGISAMLAWFHEHRGVLLPPPATQPSAKAPFVAAPG